MKIAIASDHAGVDYKARLVNYLDEKGYEIIDFGPMTEDSVDYPDFAHKVAKAISTNMVELGILFCISLITNFILLLFNASEGINFP